MIANHPNYKGLPIERKEDGSLRWIATAQSEIGKKRKAWALEKAKELGIPNEPGVYAKVMLAVTNVYFAACEELGIEKEIDGIDVIGLINKHYQILKVAESKKSTENFERYYKNFNNHLIK